MPTFEQVVDYFQVDPKESGFLVSVFYHDGWVSKSTGNKQTEHGIETATSLNTWLTALYTNPTQYVDPTP